MIYYKTDLAINIHGVRDQAVTARLMNDLAACAARPQLGLQHCAARPRICRGDGCTAGRCPSLAVVRFSGGSVAVPRPSLRQQHRALTGPRPLAPYLPGGLPGGPPGGCGSWPGAAFCRFSRTRI